MHSTENNCLTHPPFLLQDCFLFLLFLLHPIVPRRDAQREDQATINKETLLMPPPRPLPPQTAVAAPAAATAATAPIAPIFVDLATTATVRVADSQETQLFGHEIIARDTALTAVGRNGLALQVCSRSLRDDDAVVLKAVAQRGSALLYASERLRDCRVRFCASSPFQPPLEILIETTTTIPTSICIYQLQRSWCWRPCGRTGVRCSARRQG